jgi:hypothetical protein
MAFTAYLLSFMLSFSIKIIMLSVIVLNVVAPNLRPYPNKLHRPSSDTCSIPVFKKCPCKAVSYISKMFIKLTTLGHKLDTAPGEGGVHGVQAEV